MSAHLIETAQDAYVADKESDMQSIVEAQFAGYGLIVEVLTYDYQNDEYEFLVSIPYATRREDRIFWAKDADALELIIEPQGE